MRPARPLHELVADALSLEQLDDSIRLLERAPGRRKREGVFYTPAPIVEHLVDETLGRRLAELRAELDLPALAHAGDGAAYRRALDAYAARLDRLRVLDPACGAGVFLIAALQRIARERCRVAAERARLAPGEPRDEPAALRATLVHNLHGIDVDAASVELAKLALWLHAGRPAPSEATRRLDQTLRVADALLDDPHDDAPFDCIVGNPPYVKYQRWRAADPRVVAGLRARHASARQGNVDLHVPFIEQGLRRLAPGGRMGIIAPSVWIKQVQGEALRRIVRADRRLERWLDFGDAQVFAEATTYTALQFFTQRPCAAIDARHARGLALAELDWDADAHAIPYEALPTQGAWTLLGGDAGRLLARIEAAGTPLAEHVESISVGVQTSADDLYHLHELAPGRYESKGGGVIELEPALVRPLVSGTDVHRWTRPRTTRRILFPCQPTKDGVALVPAVVLQRDHPKTWAYLRTHEARLRAREGGKFDDERWFRFGRNQNIDKQHLGKILVPRLVQHLAAAPDLEGAFVADNVDVGYLITRTHEQAWFLLAILNSKVADWWFRQTSKPFRGDYRSANRQYLAPLPIPAASEEQRATLVAASRQLHTLHEQLAARLDELAGPEHDAAQASATVEGTRARAVVGRRHHEAALAERLTTDARVRELEGAIAAAELALDQRVADLYGLDAESLAFMQSG